MSSVKVTKIWKYMNGLFILLGLFLLATMPSSNEVSIMAYTYLFLTIIFATIGLAMILLPILLVISDKHKWTAVQKILWITFIVIFNIMGSYISYFWLRDIEKK
jgi:uncharacterized membrane protein